MQTILVDMDNTIADFDGEIIRRYTAKFPGQVTHHALASIPQ
jgi:5'(3')-deoxyribonucleotidase